MGNLLVACLVISGALSFLAFVRNATAYMMYRRRKTIGRDGYEDRIGTSITLMIVAVCFYLVGLALGGIMGQDMGATSNNVVGGMWLAALVFLARFRIIDLIVFLWKKLVG